MLAVSMLVLVVLVEGLLLDIGFLLLVALSLAVWSVEASILLLLLLTWLGLLLLTMATFLRVLWLLPTPLGNLILVAILLVRDLFEAGFGWEEVAVVSGFWKALSLGLMDDKLEVDKPLVASPPIVLFLISPFLVVVFVVRVDFKVVHIHIS